MTKLYPLGALLLVLLSLSSGAFANADMPAKEGVPPYLEKALAKLPVDDADQFRDTMQQAHEKNRVLTEQIHSMHDVLDAILLAEPFDIEAFRATSAKLRDVYEKMRANMDDAFASAIAELTQKERKTILTAIAYHKIYHKDKAQSKTQQ